MTNIREIKVLFQFVAKQNVISTVSLFIEPLSYSTRPTRQGSADDRRNTLYKSLIHLCKYPTLYDIR